MQCNGENDKCKTVGFFWSEGNTVKPTMWRQSLPNNYWTYFVSEGHNKENPRKKLASHIHLLRHGKSMRYIMEKRLPDWHKRSRNRRKNALIYAYITFSSIQFLCNMYVAGTYQALITPLADFIQFIIKTLDFTGF